MKGGRDDSGLHFSIHSRAKFDFAAMIVYPHTIPFRNASRPRIYSRNLQQPGFLQLLKRRDICESGIEKIVRLARQQL